ncbi:MAG: 2'-5' RNA ligase family protein [Chloroflexi bacterium]|nr:2'-5' RNA ligase family protein [Chloroflexota bacterium]
MSNADFRFAVYLIPPYRVAQPMTEVHQMLHKQFGLVAAGRFQVHATIKGFFKKADGPMNELEDRLETLFTKQRPFPVHFNGYHIDEVGIGLNISLIGDRPNPEMTALREQTVSAIRPFIAPDCDFATKDLGNPFAAHITLAFRDIPLNLYDDVLAYLQEAPLPTVPFSAQTYHFLQFSSQDWNGAWWETLQWQLLKSWHI